MLDSTQPAAPLAALLLTFTVIALGAIAAFVLQRAFVKKQRQARQDLAALLDASVATVRYDRFAVVGKAYGLPFRLFNFDKGRGGIYMAIEVDLSRPVDLSLNLASGMPDQARLSDSSADHAFWRRFRLIEGSSSLVTLIEDSGLPAVLLAGLSRSSAIAVALMARTLNFEQLDSGQHPSRALKELVNALAKFALLAEERFGTEASPAIEAK
jgi:hypothetical protein